MVLLLCAGITLSMNTATMDGSRALYGISQDGMTIRWLGKLNRNNVPGNAMTLDAVLNLGLLFLAVGPPGGGYLKILAVSNFGYVLSHIFAISGFLLLRKDRPGWPRPIRLGKIWIPIAAFCIVYDCVLLVIGSWSGAVTGYDAPGLAHQPDLGDRRARGRRAALRVPRHRRGQDLDPDAHRDPDHARGGSRLQRCMSNASGTTTGPRSSCSGAPSRVGPGLGVGLAQQALGELALLVGRGASSSRS